MPNFKLYTLIICLFFFSALTLGIYWASVESNVLQGVNEMITTRWGVITLLDFYIGASVLGIWICVMEKSMPRGLIWMLCIYLFGNLTTLAYVARRVWISEEFSDIFIPVKE